MTAAALMTPRLWKEARGLLPVWGIALGAIVLSEPIAATTLLGTVLIIGGIALVNSRYGTRPLFARSAVPAAAGTTAPKPQP